jgi:hypothetical protein
MALVMTPIFTQTAGSGGVANFTFNNIPQFYTDLKLVVSSRWNVAQAYIPLGMYFNGTTFPDTLASFTRVYGDGATALSNRSTGAYMDAGQGNGTTATANTFGNTEIYIPNYTSSNFKQIIVDGVAENNVATVNLFLSLNACLWRSTNAITKIEISTGYTALQHSTASLYGIIRNGA